MIKRLIHAAMPLCDCMVLAAYGVVLMMTCHHLLVVLMMSLTLYATFFYTEKISRMSLRPPSPVKFTGGAALAYGLMTGSTEWKTSTFNTVVDAHTDFLVIGMIVVAFLIGLTSAIYGTTEEKS